MTDQHRSPGEIREDSTQRFGRGLKRIMSAGSTLGVRNASSTAITLPWRASEAVTLVHSPAAP
jgi:hypothetical protein